MTEQSRQSAAQIAAAVVMLVGLSIFTRGVYLAWRPGGWMVGGLVVALPALFWLYNDIRNGK